MELTIFCSKKKVHKSAVIRERCKRRLREAIRLVVTRGAGNKGGGVGLNEEDVRKLGPRKWLLPGESDASRDEQFAGTRIDVLSFHRISLYRERNARNLSGTIRNARRGNEESFEESTGPFHWLTNTHSGRR